MTEFVVKNVHMGAGRPKTIVSLMDDIEQALLASAHKAVAAGADCVEWRADYASQALDLDALAHIGKELVTMLPHTPVIFTFRSTGQGGQRELSIGEYVALIRHIIANRSADIVDIELGIEDKAVCSLAREAHEQGIRTIVSHHDFARTPSTEHMTNTLVHMAALGADLPKLAVMAHGSSDCLRLLQATTCAHEQLQQPVITMAMGPEGTLSRLVGETVGSAATFCALNNPSAPGQVSLELAVRALDALHACR